MQNRVRFLILLMVLSVLWGFQSNAQGLDSLKDKIPGMGGGGGDGKIAGMDRAQIEAKIKELTAKKGQTKNPLELKAIEAQIAELKKKLAELKKKK